jgi:hypothetical protein
VCKREASPSSAKLRLISPEKRGNPRETLALRHPIFKSA